MRTKTRPQTPLGRLWVEKRELRRQCRVTEKKIEDDWRYIRLNSGQLLLGGVAAFFRSRRGNGTDAVSGEAHTWMYLFWQIVRPIAYRWMGEMGWQVFKSMFRKKRG